MKSDGFVAGAGVTPEQFTAQIQEETKKWATVVKKGGIELN
ncbi:hypothetical protein WKW77_33280 [Variovorax ureilyticus]|uniref:Tripartite tricarboxylate transporter family receptor n=1 Tax=Variovorax ureilyticus TaxID=1836198 RepID=A0ABU8VSG3_9BURK